MKKIFMLSGLPRSGSTVLASMMNQHPDIEVTTTSPILDVMNMVEESWDGVSAADLKRTPKQLHNILNGIMQNGHAHREKSIIIDKHRMWPRKYKLLNELGNTKIICTTRNISEIIASFIILIKKNAHQVTYIDQDLIEMKLPINTKNRANVLLQRYIMHPYNSFKLGFNSKKLDLLLLDYHDIVGDPQTTVNRVTDFVGAERFDVDSNNLQPMNENDDAHGGLKGLHHIRPQLIKTSPSARDVLGTELFNYYNDMRLEFWK